MLSQFVRIFDKKLYKQNQLSCTYAIKQVCVCVCVSMTYGIYLRIPLSLLCAQCQWISLRETGISVWLQSHDSQIKPFDLPQTERWW